jgi:uncharacterized membrane protein YagU involved in acid resistance
MAMTGMRNVTAALGLLEEAPPRAILRKQSKGLIRMVPRKKRRGVIEVFHWGVGVQGGVGYALLPENVRRTRWSGPVYGLVMWAFFDAVAAPAMGVDHAKDKPIGQRVALMADHLVYGLILSETRPRPRE